MRRIRYAKAERALMAYLKGERISHLRAVGSELFPLPEETSPCSSRLMSGGISYQPPMELKGPSP